MHYFAYVLRDKINCTVRFSQSSPYTFALLPSQGRVNLQQLTNLTAQFILSPSIMSQFQTNTFSKLGGGIKDKAPTLRTMAKIFQLIILILNTCS